MDNLKFEDIAFLTVYFPRIQEVLNGNFEMTGAYKLMQVKEYFIDRNKTNKTNKKLVFWNLFMYLRQRFMCLKMEVCLNIHEFKFTFDDIKSFNNEFTFDISQTTKDDWDYVVENILKSLLEIKGYKYSIEEDIINIIIDTE
jgi:hypothetical protein